MNIKQQILSYSGVNIINSSVPFLLLPILTNHLSTADYGILSLIQLLIALSLPFVLMNSQGLLTIEYSNFSKQKYKNLISSAILLPFFGFLLLQIVFFFFKDIITEYFHLPLFYLHIIPLFVLFQAIPLIIPVIFQAKKEPLNFGKFKIAMTLTNLLLSLLFVVILGFGWEGRLWGIVGAYTIFSIIGIIVIIKLELFRFKIDASSLKNLLSYGLPLIPHSLAAVVLSGSSRFFLGNMMGESEIGMFSVAFQLASAVITIMISVNQAWAPNLFEILNKYPNHKTKIKVVNQTYKIMIFMLIITITFIILCPLIFKLFININYHQGIQVSQVIAFAFLFQGLYFMVTNYIYFTKRTEILSYITLASSLIVLVANYYFIDIYGIIGAAYALVLTYIFLFCVVFYYANRLIPMPWLYKFKRNDN